MKNTNKYQKQARVMKNAWKEYNSSSNKISSFQVEMSFSECLKEAWEIEKMTKQDVYNSINEYSVRSLQNILITKDAEFYTILEVVADRSKGFQADIATKALKYRNITEKQAWCIAYEYKKVA